MSGGQGYERIVTPEAVAIELDVAGLGSRGIAIGIDMVIQTIVMLAIVFLVIALELGDVGTQVILAVSFPLVFWVYFFVFEGLWRGRTPGKRAMRLRAVRVNGQPMSGAQMFVRNLIRIVDFLPTAYAIGAVVMVISTRSQRLGDLAAGTLVIREARALSVSPIAPPPPPPAGSVDARHRDDDRGAVPARPLVPRAADTLDPTARVHLASQVASVLRPIVRPPSGIADERLIETAADAYRRRFGAVR